MLDKLTLLHHERNELKLRGRWASGLGVGSVGMSGVEDRLPLLAEFGLAFWLTSGGLVVLGLGILIWSVAHFAPARYPRCDELDIRDARRDEIPVLHAALERYTGTALAPLDRRIAIHKRNPRCFQVIYMRSHEPIAGRIRYREIHHGYLIVYPLRSDAWRRIRNGEMTGKDITADHIVSRFRHAKALYISFAEGDDFSSKGFIIEMIRDLIEVYEVPVVTRPTTRKSLALVRKLRMRKIDGRTPEMNTLCWQDYEELAKGAERLKARRPRLAEWLKARFAQGAPA